MLDIVDGGRSRLLSLSVYINVGLPRRLFPGPLLSLNVTNVTQQQEMLG